MAKFELKTWDNNVPDEELLDDLKAVASMLKPDALTIHKYKNYGKFDQTTFRRRFGSWNNALKSANIIINKFHNIEDVELFENLEDVWMKIGRQPSYGDMQEPLSKYSGKPYVKRFGSWRKALVSFVEIANSDDDIDCNRIDSNYKNKCVRKTTRDPNWKLRYRVLARDGAKCRLCGRSSTEAILHVDHIQPWSKGGETTLENLQILCEQCNIGKGNSD
jgi:hypothetical protein